MRSFSPLHLKRAHFVFSLLLLLLGCKPSCSPIESRFEAYCGAYCSTCELSEIDQRHLRIPGLLATEESLIGKDINVVHLGERTTLIIPADDIFYSRSPRILSQAKSILQLVDYYLGFFDTVSINVDVYTDNFDNPLRNHALSRARAQNVIDFMWRDKIDTRLLSAKGLGPTMPIASNRDRHGRLMNRRIEISFNIYNAKQLFVS